MPNNKNFSVAQTVIVFITLTMLTVNSGTMFIIKNIMQQTMIDNEHKYLSEIVKNISVTSEQTVLRYIAVCDVLAMNDDFITILKESDQNNPMQDHELANSVALAMNDVMESHGNKIMSMAVFDIEQDAYLLNTGVASGSDFSFSQRPYFAPVHTHTYIVTEPYLDVLTNGLVVTIVTPVFDETGETLGVVGLDLPIDFISNLVIDSSFGDSGRSLVLDETFKIIAYSDIDYINEDYTSLKIVGNDFEQELINPTGELVEYNMMGETRLGMLSRIDSLNWTVLTAMDYGEFDQISSIIIVLMIVSGMFTLIICNLLISGKLTKELIQLHYKDSLTGLYNRAGFSTRVDELMKAPPATMGVLSLNINGLKHINDATGTASGDAHIKNCTKTFIDHFGYEFFRMSGDEFVAIAPQVEEKKFEERINLLYEYMRENNNYDFSFGYAFAQKNYNVWKLIQEAETIMIINKQEYYASATKQGTVNNAMLSQLLNCIKDDEFIVYLQAQVHLKDGSLYGAEALIRRFDKKNNKMVFPDEFISLYEKNSIIRHVDLFVVDRVCQLLQEWNNQNRAIPISVNLSRVTLQEFGIVNSIVKICDKYNVPHKYLVIEVTERVGLVENNVASSLIHDFQKNGFHISLDDFGCAYSNIVTLAQIEVDEVKIDKSLVDDITISKKNLVLVKNVLSMCNELENTVTLAEGIETIEQADMLNDLGCSLGQGYYYSKPIPIDEFVEKYM